MSTSSTRSPSSRIKRTIRFIGAVALPVVLVASAIHGWATLSRYLQTPAASLGPARSEPLPVTEPPIALTLDRISLIEWPQARAARVALSGDWLLGVNYATDTPLVARSLSGETIELQPLLEKQAVGGRFALVSAGRSAGAFYLSDPAQITVLHVVLGRDALAPVVIEAMRAESGLASIVDVGQGEMLANGLFSDDLLLRLQRSSSTELRVTHRLGAPLFPDVTAPKIALNLNRSSLGAHPDGHHIVQAFRYTPRLHVYTSSGELERMLAGPVDVRLMYQSSFSDRYEFDRFGSHPDMRHCYLDVVADDRWIYALFSGRAWGAFREKALFGDQLHVFTWDGRHVTNLRLPDAVSGLALDRTRRQLYGVMIGTPARIGVYAVPATLPLHPKDVGETASARH